MQHSIGCVYATYEQFMFVVGDVLRTDTLHNGIHLLFVSPVCFDVTHSLCLFMLMTQLAELSLVTVRCKSTQKKGKLTLTACSPATAVHACGSKRNYSGKMDWKSLFIHRCMCESAT